MVERAVVVSGDYSPTADVGRETPLTMTPGGRLRVEAAAGGGTGASAQQVQGNAASGATDVGNPVKVGAVFNTTPPTIANGQRADLQTDASGNLRSRIVTASGSGADGFLNTQMGFATARTDQTTALLFATSATVFNGTTWDRQRGDTGGTWVTPGLLLATTDRSGTATTTSGGLNVAANASRRGLVGQNISAVNIGFNEQGGTAAIGTAGTYTVAPGAAFSISTNKLVNFIAASGTAAVTMTEW